MLYHLLFFFPSSGSNKAAQDYNFPRQCITHFFHSHKCFVFERPASTTDLQRLEELSESQLEPKFVKQAQRFCDFVFEESQRPWQEDIVLLEEVSSSHPPIDMMSPY